MTDDLNMPAGGERLLRVPTVREMTGLSRSTLYRLIAQKRFPAPLKPLGDGSSMAAWRLSDVTKWINERAA
jgi:prophage regulatory protein